MTYEIFSNYRADLMRDFAPANTQEQFLVDEVAHSWRRLMEARHRERLFFDLQRHYQARLNGSESDKSFQKDGAEVIMWLESPHKAYNQILRSVRDADLSFDRAYRRLEATIDRRLRRALLIRKSRPAPASTQFDGFSVAHAWQTLETPISAAWNGRPFPKPAPVKPHPAIRQNQTL